MSRRIAGGPAHVQGRAAVERVGKFLLHLADYSGAAVLVTNHVLGSNAAWGSRQGVLGHTWEGHAAGRVCSFETRTPGHGGCCTNTLTMPAPFPQARTASRVELGVRALRRALANGRRWERRGGGRSTCGCWFGRRGRERVPIRRTRRCGWPRSCKPRTSQWGRRCRSTCRPAPRGRSSARRTALASAWLWMSVLHGIS